MHHRLHLTAFIRLGKPDGGGAPIKWDKKSNREVVQWWIFLEIGNQVNGWGSGAKHTLGVAVGTQCDGDGEAAATQEPGGGGGLLVAARVGVSGVK